MTGNELVRLSLAGQPTHRLPCLPILHSGLPPLFGVPLGHFFTSADTMAEVIVRGYRTFGYDGVQLSLGVTGEAEALGAAVAQPEDGAPVLRQHLLPDLTDAGALAALHERAEQMEPARAGRLPLFFDAVAQTVEATGGEAFVLATMRGPLLIASQLCGVEPLLISMITHPDAVRRLLAITTELAARLGAWLLESGADGLMLGEATCSPNFISPRLYRSLVQPMHTALVSRLRSAASPGGKRWKTVGLHICGNVAPLLEDVIATGVTWMDIDHQVPAPLAWELAQGRLALRGNLDPSSIFRFGAPNEVRAATEALVTALSTAVGPAPARWIASSGCDIPPDTPPVNIQTFVDTLAEGGRLCPY